MVDKLIKADVLTRAIVDSPSDVSGYNPVYCDGVAKRQLEILNIILEIGGTTEGEIRANAITEFAERLKNKIELKYCRADLTSQYVGMQTCEWIDEIVEQMKGGAE